MFRGDHIAMYVSDLERSSRFYASCFGAKVLSKPSPHFVELAINDFRLHLLKPTSFRPANPALKGIDHFCLSVENHAELVALTERLRQSEWATAEPIAIQSASPLADGHVEERPPCHVLYFKDPDGILIEVRSYG